MTNPFGPEMEADYRRRKARFYASFEKKRQEAEATFKKYEDHYREKMACDCIDKWDGKESFTCPHGWRILAISPGQGPRRD